MGQGAAAYWRSRVSEKQEDLLCPRCGAREVGKHFTYTIEEVQTNDGVRGRGPWMMNNAPRKCLLRCYQCDHTEEYPWESPPSLVSPRTSSRTIDPWGKTREVLACKKGDLPNGWQRDPALRDYIRSILRRDPGAFAVSGTVLKWHGVWVRHLNYNTGPPELKRALLDLFIEECREHLEECRNRTNEEILTWVREHRSLHRCLCDKGGTYYDVLVRYLYPVDEEARLSLYREIQVTKNTLKTMFFARQTLEENVWGAVE